jgi:virginiamycin A acetyltransferase
LFLRQAARVVFERLTQSDYKEKKKIIIPFGRQTYGPQPILLGYMPWIAIKAQGSKIGNFCSLGSNLQFSFLGKHNYGHISTYPFYYFYNKWAYNDATWQDGKPDTAKIEPQPIIIENDVWIANNVIIKEGVRICNGAVVAMESVVTKDVPPYALVGGNPAEVIRYRFNQQQIDSLQKISWWNWPDSKIKKLLPLILSENIEAFIEAAERNS